MERGKYESLKFYNDRMDFIERYKNDNPDDKKEAVRLSYIFVYVKNYNCKYSSYNFKKIKKYINYK